ncbi:replication terminator protein [Candidatus Enterococcus leclercqii]|uniref:replication terminator protein n=1 Tax=Candidatus Enterococcus leclercqii TaxID=1857218 RepID=UPI00137A49D3|nr:replication terminator protein [Enterococcus sp. CU9D]KAF1291076.1 replication terminator protein [Enterococcus sp. CU9D]
MTKEIDLQLSELANGAIQEKLNGELEKVFANIHDPNTPATAKRGVTIKLEFKPDENRQVVTVSSDFSVKVAPVEGVSTTVLTGKDLATGKVEAHELKSTVPGQTFIDPVDGEVKTDVGVPIDVIEKEQAKQKQIIDLQQKRG